MYKTFIFNLNASGTASSPFCCTAMHQEVQRSTDKSSKVLKSTKKCQKYQFQHSMHRNELPQRWKQKFTSMKSHAMLVFILRKGPVWIGTFLHQTVSLYGRLYTRLLSRDWKCSCWFNCLVGSRAIRKALQCKTVAVHRSTAFVAKSGCSAGGHFKLCALHCYKSTIFLRCSFFFETALQCKNVL